MPPSEQGIRSAYFNSLATRIDKNLKIYEEMSRLVTDSERKLDVSSQIPPTILSNQATTASDLREIRSTIRHKQSMGRNLLTNSIVEEARNSYAIGSTAHLNVASHTSSLRSLHRPRPLPAHITKFLSDELKQSMLEANEDDGASRDPAAFKNDEKLNRTLGRVASIIDTTEINGEVAEPDVILAKFYNEDPYVANVKLVINNYNIKRGDGGGGGQPALVHHANNQKQTEKRIKTVEERMSALITARENQMISIISSACSAPSIRKRQMGNICSIDKDWKDLYVYKGASNFTKTTPAGADKKLPARASSARAKGAVSVSPKNEIMNVALSAKKCVAIADQSEHLEQHYGPGHGPEFDLAMVPDKYSRPFTGAAEGFESVTTEALIPALDRGKNRAHRCLQRHGKVLPDTIIVPSNDLTSRITKEVTKEITNQCAERTAAALNFMSTTTLKSSLDTALSHNPLINSHTLKARSSNRIAQLHEDALEDSDSSDSIVTANAKEQSKDSDNSSQDQQQGSRMLSSCADATTLGGSSLQINSVHIQDKRSMIAGTSSFRRNAKNMQKTVQAANDETLFNVIIPDNKYDKRNEFNFLSEEDIARYKKILVYIHNDELLDKIQRAETLEDYERHIQEYNIANTPIDTKPKKDDNFASILKAIMPQDRMQTFAAYSSLSSMDTASYKREIVHRLLNLKRAITKTNLRSNDSKLQLYESAKAILQPLLQSRLAARKYPEDCVMLSTRKSDMQLTKQQKSKLWDAKEIKES